MKRREEKEKWNDKKKKKGKTKGSEIDPKRAGINSSRKVVGQFRGSLSAET